MVGELADDADLTPCFLAEAQRTQRKSYSYKGRVTRGKKNKDHIHPSPSGRVNIYGFFYIANLGCTDSRIMDRD